MSETRKRWSAFMEAEPEAAAERLELLDRVQTSGWTQHFNAIHTAGRMLRECMGTKNEERWRDEVLRNVLRAAEVEHAKDELVESLIREEIRKRLDSRSEDEVVHHVFAYPGAGGTPNDCERDRVRLAVFSDDDHDGAGSRLGCQDLTAAEARKVAAALVAAADVVDERGADA